MLQVDFKMQTTVTFEEITVEVILFLAANMKILYRVMIRLVASTAFERKRLFV